MDYYEKYLKYKKKYTEYKKTFGGGNDNKICVVGDIEGFFNYFVSFILFSDAFTLNTDNDEVKKLISEHSKDYNFIVNDINDEKKTIDRTKLDDAVNCFSNFTTLDWFKLKTDYTFVFMGDVCDREMGSIRITNILLYLKKINGDRVIWLIGNRDINKLRLLYELNNEYANKEYVLTTNKDKTISMIDEYFNQDTINPILDGRTKYLSDKNNLNSKMEYFKLLMFKTYGAAQDINKFRGKELELLYGSSSNEMIYVSYILSVFNDYISVKKCRSKKSNTYDVDKIKQMLSYYIENYSEKESVYDKIILDHIKLCDKKGYRLNFMYEYLKNGYLMYPLNNTLFLHGGLISQNPKIADIGSLGYLKCYVNEEYTDDNGSKQIKRIFKSELKNKSQVTHNYDTPINYMLSEYDKNKPEVTFVENDGNFMNKINNINTRCRELIDNYINEFIQENVNNDYSSEKVKRIQFYYRQITESSLMTYPSPISGRHLDNGLYPITLNSLLLDEDLNTKKIFKTLLDELKQNKIDKVIVGHTPHGITPTIIDEPNNELVTIMVDTSVDDCGNRENSVYNIIVDTSIGINKVKIRGLINNKMKKMSGNAISNFNYDSVINMDYNINDTSERKSALFSKIIDIKNKENFQDILFHTCIDEGSKFAEILKSDERFNKYFIKCKIGSNENPLYLLLKCNGFNYVYLLVNETDVKRYIE